MKDKELQLLFSTLDNNNTGAISVAVFKSALLENGLHTTVIKEAIKLIDPESTGSITFAQFKKLKEAKSDLVERALRGQLAIPDWSAFCKDLVAIYTETSKNNSGEKATYIPQLSRVDESQFGLSVLTVDCQTFSHGDSDTQFTIQSCSKPITYCMAELDIGAETVKKHVGHEPSGRKFNHFELDENNLPHNPMINAGAIMTASLLKTELEPADRFDYALAIWRRLAGGASGIGFDNATYLSELRHADRNFALAYFMKDKGAFGDNVATAQDLQGNLEFYFQLCSILATCDNVAAAAATLANGGVNPLTNDLVFPTQTVRNCLSLMFSCGMYDYSGEFSYAIGLPAKSGVAGCVYCVVPNLMGICVWSPKLDAQGNSVKGVEFFTRLTELYALHIFDDATKGGKKKNPRLRLPANAKLHAISEMCYAAANGDITLMRNMVVSGLSVSVADYDGRTPLHLAAAEGRAKAVEWLLNHGASPSPKDRWGTTPLDEATSNNRTECAKLLTGAGAVAGADD